MSTFRSNKIAADRSRPDDHFDAVATAAAPPLRPTQWLRWAWRQLTGMRTAILLLLLLAIAAVPGSIFPQRSADPNGVVQYYEKYPDAAPVLEWLQVFDLYSSAWFSAIYILLFVSLIGCVIPRTHHHWKALRARPPRTPARLSRLDHYIVTELPPAGDQFRADELIVAATADLRRRGYRVARYDGLDFRSVSAERGYLRESANLVFHASLVGILISTLASSGFSYTGQRVIVEGTTFVNSLNDYSSFTPGRFVDGSELEPYALTLDSFEVSYVQPGAPGSGQAGNFSAKVTILDDGSPQERDIRVNYPITVGADRVYLLGNGYAPTITVRDALGTVVYSDSQPFLPQDSAMTSLGIIKVPDGLAEQVGLVGFLYPTQGALDSGAKTSVFPDLMNPVVTFNVFSGSLGINDGSARSVYTLDTTAMTQQTGGTTGVESIELAPGESAPLPNGWGSVTFEDESAGVANAEAVKRFASLDFKRDFGAPWVLGFAILATLGLITALLVPRRRVWVKASTFTDANGRPAIRLEHAALARGEDPQLKAALALIHEQQSKASEISSARTSPERKA